MAIKLVANYSKRLGLPGYSSHQYSICVEVEIINCRDIAEESARLYAELQSSVDAEIQQTGFVPHDGYGSTAPPPTNGHVNGSWLCSEKQRDLILRLIEEHSLDKAEVEAKARSLFQGKGVKQLNKLEASGLIDRLLEEVGEKPVTARRSRSGAPPAYRKGGAR